MYLHLNTSHVMVQGKYALNGMFLIEFKYISCYGSS